jgi:hypothetical protein
MARHLICDARVTAHIELECSRDGHDGAGLMSILKEGEAERFFTTNKKATTTVLLVLRNPVAVAVLADKEDVGLRRRRFLLTHDTSPQILTVERRWLVEALNVSLTAYEFETNNAISS